MLLQSLMSNDQDDRNMQYAKMLNGTLPLFSQFGQNIYASDIVQMCIDTIAQEMSKLQPRHIFTGTSGVQQVPNSTINALFKFAPNELMTTSEFIEKFTWLLLMNYNTFIYPVYSTYTAPNGNTSRIYSALYPINPTRVEFLQDPTGTLYVKFTFRNGQHYTLPYSDIIHIRKKYSVNDFMGGGENGQPDNQALLDTLQVNDTVMQGIAKAVKTTLTIRGILKINTMLDTDKKKAERDNFEKDLLDGTSGIIPMDFKEDYVPLTVDPKLIDKDTMQFIQDKILNWYGVSIPILTGDYNDDQYQSFYEKTLEPILVRAAQAFSKTMFTARELQVGNEIVFYQKDMQYLSTQSKLNLLQIAGAQGILSDNQKLQLLGYGPIPGGERYTQSLNYVDKNLINDYQMKKAGSGSTNNTDDTQQGQLQDTVEQTTGQKLNGAQIQSLLSIIQSYKSGAITKNSAITIMTSTLGIGKDEAEQILDDGTDIVDDTINKDE